MPDASIAHLCVTCGTQFAPSADPPPSCPICDDDRQYIHAVRGQQWTTLDEMRGRHHNRFVPIEPGVTAIVTSPSFGIGQQAYLIETAAGNVLWDLIAYVDETTVAELDRRGGVRAIAISHPHYFTTMVEWSRALGDVPVLLHESYRAWVMRPDDCVAFWPGETHELAAELTLIRTGGHFPGGTVLHWDNAGTDRDGAGVLFTGDLIAVKPHAGFVTFMYSYPNDIPLDAVTVRRIVDRVAPYAFDRVRDAFDMHIVRDGHDAVRTSAERYIRHLEGRAGPTI